MSFGSHSLHFFMFHLVATNYTLKSLMVYIYLKSISKNCVIVWCCSFYNLASLLVSNSKGWNSWCQMGALTFWLSTTHENAQSCLRVDMNVFNIACTWIFLELLATKLFLFGNIVIQKIYNMTFTSKLIISLLSLVAISWSSFHPTSCIKF